MSDAAGDELMELQRQEIREKQYDRDVGLGNNYRLECIKHCMTLATGALVFTVTFKKDYLAVPGQTILGITFATAGWLFLVLSLACGIWHMQCWEHYYFAWILEPMGKDAERAGLTRLWIGGHVWPERCSMPRWQLACCASRST